jgi:LPXTG-site transpeptidase (sortase) family protein
MYGTPINFTLDISHAAISSAPAYDVILTDVLPAGLAYIPLSVSSTGLAPNDMIYDPATSTLTFEWANFPLAATSTISFQATFIGPSPVANLANLEWTSIEIDPQLDGTPEQRSIHNIFATERWFDPPTQTINDYQASASVTIQTPDNNLPSTGFKLGESTVLPLQPKIKTYTDLGKIWLEIPKLKLKMPITGVPYVKNDWDLTWLSDQAGYLEGSTFPGQVGNTAITGHVVLADGTPGPFQNIEKLVWGDQIILHINGEKFIYELRKSTNVLPSDYSLFRYDGYSWVTLITCDEYNKATDTYLKRTLVKAVLVKIEVD